MDAGPALRDVNQIDGQSPMPHANQVTVLAFLYCIVYLRTCSQIIDEFSQYSCWPEDQVPEYPESKNENRNQEPLILSLLT